MIAVILAAGESSRFWPLNTRHKSLFKIIGKPILWYTVSGLLKCGIKKIFLVQSPKRDVEENLKKYNFPIKYLIQKKPTGTGDALLLARKFINEDQFFLINAERFDCEDFLPKILEKFKRVKKGAILLTCQTNFPWQYGILKIKKERVFDVVEKPEKGREPSNWKMAGIYFLPKDFFSILEKLPSHPFSLTNAISLYSKKKKVFVVKAKEELPGLKYPWNLFSIKKKLFDKFLRERIPANLKNVNIEGKVFIEENVKILQGATIKGPCFIGTNSFIGNHSLIREYSNLEEGCTIGAFAEVKNTIFQENCFTHSGYFGDSIFGKNCFVGAGVITANLRLDRKEVKSVVKGEKINTHLKKFGTVVGENTKIGVHCSIMPGVLIGANCQIGPHSLIMQNIKDKTVFYPEIVHKVE